jgi:2-polyprenyl-6-methoxyphenol hydroxylase-like FAD-dependent oxidoreductase
MEKMNDRPLTIIGGGIAGLSLGVGLRRRGVPVTIIEAATYPRHRVCGEFISGVSPETLASLGVADLLDDAEVCRETAWHDASGPILRKTLPSPALGISRFRLDRRMVDRFRELGGELREGERYRENGAAPEGHLFATGRSRDVTSPWLGLKGHLIDYPLEADLEMHLGDGGYIGLSRIEDGRVNACGLFRRRSDLHVQGSGALLAYLTACGLGKLATRLDRAGLDPESLTGVSAFQFGRQEKSESGSVRLGDRFSIIGPFTGHGMSMAFQSAAIVLPLLRDYAGGGIGWDEVVRRSDSLLSRSFRRRLGVSRLVHPFLTSDRGRRVMSTLARRNWLPFSLLYRATR